MGTQTHQKAQMDTKHKPRLNTQKHIRPGLRKLSFHLFYFRTINSYC